MPTINVPVMKGVPAAQRIRVAAHHACVANHVMRGRDVVDAVLMVLPAALRVDVKVVIANASRTLELCHTKWRLEENGGGGMVDVQRGVGKEG